MVEPLLSSFLLLYKFGGEAGIASGLLPYGPSGRLAPTKTAILQFFASGLLPYGPSGRLAPTKTAILQFFASGLLPYGPSGRLRRPKSLSCDLVEPLLSSFLLLYKFGGEAGIRTLGGFPLNGFQDRRFRPLSHLSNTLSLASMPQLLAGSRSPRPRHPCRAFASAAKCHWHFGLRSPTQPPLQYIISGIHAGRHFTIAAKTCQCAEPCRGYSKP